MAEFMQENIVLAMLFAFVLGIATDIFWAKWTVACNKKQAAAAAIWVLLIDIAGVTFSLFLINGCYLMTAASIVGAVIGTYVAVKLDKGDKEGEAHDLP